jgi:hypothetical protein
MKVTVDVFDQNWGFRVSYPGAAASPVESARQALEQALRDGYIHKDEAKFCRMRVRSTPDDLD